jgi:hypothetical protein
MQAEWSTLWPMLGEYPRVGVDLACISLTRHGEVLHCQGWVALCSGANPARIDLPTHGMEEYSMAMLKEHL